jgi:hypothetical protein
VVDHFGRACGSAQHRCVRPPLSGIQIVRHVDDQLRTCLVNLRSTPEHVRTAHSELKESAFDRPRAAIGLALRVCPGEAVWHLVCVWGTDVTAIDSGSRSGEHPAGRAGGFGGARDLGGDLPGGMLGVAVTGQESLDVTLGRPSKGTRDVEVVGQRPCRDEDPASLGGGAYLFPLRPGEPGQGHAGVMGSSDRQWHLRRCHALRSTWGLRGPARGRPVRVGVSQPSSPEHEVTGFGGGAGDLTNCVGIDVVDRMRGCEPEFASAPGSVGGRGQLSADLPGCWPSPCARRGF